LLTRGFATGDPPESILAFPVFPALPRNDLADLGRLLFSGSAGRASPSKTRRTAL
jgi:hypothetical protein